MTVIPETMQNSDNEDQLGGVEENQARVTREEQEGVRQVQNQGSTGTTGGQEEHQNNGTAKGSQDQKGETFENTPLLTEGNTILGVAVPQEHGAKHIGCLVVCPMFAQVLPDSIK